jgi:serine protease
VKKNLIWLPLCWAGLVAFLLSACTSLFQPPPVFDSVIVNFVDTVSAEQVATISEKYKLDLQLNSSSEYAQAEELYKFLLNGIAPRPAADLMRRLTQEPLIEYAEPNYIYEAALVPNDQLYDQQWNLQAIKMPEAWDVTSGSGVTVAVIDTGVTRVPDLAQTKLVKGYDFVDKDEDTTDLNGHGTHVAGTIAQSTNNHLGVAGIAYQASIMPIRVLDANGFGSVSDIVEGIRFAADHGATVINMSLGGRMPTQLMAEAVKYAYDKGVTVIAAAGNENSDQVSFPGRYPHVIGVSAVGPTGEKAPYSNYGVGVDIAAPGGAKTSEHPEWGILQQTINRRNPEQAEFVYLQGTSMAAPHVAGVAALIQAEGIRNPDEVEKRLKLSATSVPNDKLNYFGAGRLNAQGAVIRGTQLEDEHPLVLWAKDFLHYLATNGYLNPRFWLDGGPIALIPKLLIVIGGYIILILVRWWLAPKWLAFSWPLLLGLVFGSSGFFVLQGIAIVGFPRWPLQLLGSSIPEMGTALVQTSALNPVFASVLIPTAAILLCLGHPQLRWLAIGLSVGMASHLLFTGTFFYEGVVWFGGSSGRIFLLLNGCLCLWLAMLAIQSTSQAPSRS